MMVIWLACDVEDVEEFGQPNQFHVGRCTPGGGEGGRRAIFVQPIFHSNRCARQVSLASVAIVCSTVIAVAAGSRLDDS